jgi:proline iminopeptidase
LHVDVDGTRLWFDVEGPSVIPGGRSMREPPTVVLLLHGGPGSYDHSYVKPHFGRLAGHALQPPAAAERSRPPPKTPA